MLHDETMAHLKDSILPFWHSLRDDMRGGFCGYVDYNLTRDWNAHRGCILCSRILWTFSMAALLPGGEMYLEDARHAYLYLHRFFDDEHNGLYWSVDADGRPLDRTKHVYCQAFAIYGLAAYARAAGEQEPLKKAMNLFELIESKCRDERGYGEAYGRDFSPADNDKLSENGVCAQRTMNTLLHVMEAYTLLFRVTGEEKVRLCIEGILKVFLHNVYNPKRRRLEVFFDGDMCSILDMQSFGHDIEASWLIWDSAGVALPAEELEPYRDLCLHLADSVFQRAYKDGSLINEQVGEEADLTRIWWVQAEAIVGFANAYTLCGDARYLKAAEAIWKTVKNRFADRRPGSEWFWSLTPALEPNKLPIVEEWKCPYHNGRMCMELKRLGV